MMHLNCVTEPVKAKHATINLTYTCSKAINYKLAFVILHNNYTYFKY